MVHVRRVLGVSERRACRAVGQARSTQRYEACKAEKDGPLRKRLRVLSRRHPRYGYRRVWALLRREGWPLNRKRVRRLWRDEGLRVSPQPRKRRRLGSSENSSTRLRAERKNQKEIEHRTTKVNRPQKNGYIERFHRTLLDEHLRVMGRTKWYETLEEMQQDLDVYVTTYNGKRPHRGRGMDGRTPYRVFKAGLKKAKEAAKARPEEKEEKQAA